MIRARFKANEDDYPITNGYTEALNGVAKVINRQGRGYTFGANTEIPDPISGGFIV